MTMAFTETAMELHLRTRQLNLTFTREQLHENTAAGPCWIHFQIARQSTELPSCDVSHKILDIMSMSPGSEVIRWSMVRSTPTKIWLLQPVTRSCRVRYSQRKRDSASRRYSLNCPAYLKGLSQARSSASHTLLPALSYLGVHL